MQTHNWQANELRLVRLGDVDAARIRTLVSLEADGAYAGCQRVRG